MIRHFLRGCMAAVALFSAIGVNASENTPEAWLPSPGTAMRVIGLSDNGQWGVSVTVGDLDTDNPQTVGGTLVNMATRELIPVGGGKYGLASLNDVTDDGGIIVGSVDYLPGFWTRSTNSWEALPLPTVPDRYQNKTKTLKYDCGALRAVTPDGRYAVGYAGMLNEPSIALPVMYDLQQKSFIDLPNMPMAGMNRHDYHENSPSAISADGRYIVGMVAESIMMDAETDPECPSVMWAYVYDRQESSDMPYRAIGFHISDSGKFTPKYEGENFIDCVKASPDGKWITGVMRMAKSLPGSMFNDDYGVAFRYYVPNGTFELLDASADKDVGGFAIDNYGTIYGAMPWENPYPEAMVRSGNYFFPLTQIFRQAYGYDLETAIGDFVTGRPVAVSGDGMVLSFISGEQDGYVLSLKERLAEGAKGVDLLGSYSVEPKSGAALAKVKSFTLTFDRDIAFAGDYSRITFVKSDGSTLVKALSAKVPEDNPKNLVVDFRTTQLAAGETYRLVIPAGFITLAGDASMKNKEISVTYKGRGQGAVGVKDIYPVDGAQVASFDSSSNPIIITFDTDIKVKDDAPAVLLYEEGINVPKTELIAGASGNMLYIYPISTQYLFEGVKYHVEIPAGIVTDLGGSGANEAMTLNYTGLYVREINSDDTYLFRADGSINAFLQFITYDGDLREPASEPASWGFTAATPWWGVMSSETSGDLAFASHSMYVPEGKSDDWLMTPQLFIPNEDVVLMFDVQGYRRSANDILNVYVYSSEDGYQSLNAQLADKIRKEADLIYSQRAEPGATEGGLEGEWTHVSIPLAPYAGKPIYIAFVNENDSQSAIFLDNIQVIRNVPITLSFRHNPTMIAADNVKIEGVLTVKSVDEPIYVLQLDLYDTAGKYVDTVEDDELELNAGDTFRFSFDKPVSLPVGQQSAIRVEVKVNYGEPIVIEDRITNLAFETTKRVVLEEYTGSECGNCPQGIVAIERLLGFYPNNFIPITMRCYKGDILGTAVQDYAAYLGLRAAPSARINRHAEILSPMVSVGNDYLFSGEGLQSTDGSPMTTWADAVAAELQNYADADIDFTVNYDAATRELDIPITVTYALNRSGQSVKLLGIVLEDKLNTYQINYFNNIEDDDLLPWSKGGSLAQGLVYYDFDDVARGYLGVNYGGTGGLLPVAPMAGKPYEARLTGQLPKAVEDDKVGNAKVVVMMIDDITGQVINANIAKVGGSTGEVQLPAAANEEITIFAADGRICAVAADGSNVTVEVYNPAGTLLSRSSGIGAASVGDIHRQPVAIVRASTAKSVKTAKISIK